MPLQIPTGFAHVTHLILDGNTAKTNSVSYGVSLGTYVDNLLLAQDLHEEFFASWDSELDNSLSLLTTRLLIGQPPGPPITAEYSPGASLFLRNVGSAAAGANGAIVSKKTPLAGRQFRGRIFLPGAVGEADVDEAGRLTPARVTALQAVASLWRQHLDDGSGGSMTAAADMVLLHGSPKSGGIIPVPTNVTSLVVRSIYGIVRRRRPRA